MRIQMKLQRATYHNHFRKGNGFASFSEDIAVSGFRDGQRPRKIDADYFVRKFENYILKRCFKHQRK